MSLDEEIKILKNNEIENIIGDIDSAKKKGKDISYFSFFFPWISLTIWKLLVYTNILTGTFWDLFNIQGFIVFVFIFVFLISWYLLLALPVYLFGLFFVWKPVRKLLPSLPFYGCFTSKGCEQLKEKINDIRYEKQIK